MTLYGVGLGPGDAGLVTVRGREILESADMVYTPGRLSRGVASEYVGDEQLSDLDFPMTGDEEKVRRAGKDALLKSRRRNGGVRHSTFGHLRRTLTRFHPEVEVVPGVSTVTAFATAFDVEIPAGAELTLREASGGAAPTGPDRLVLFKVTDVPATDEKLRHAGYEVVYGRRLFMDDGDSIVTSDADTLAERDYYTVAYAEKPDAIEGPTALFE